MSSGRRLCLLALLSSAWPEAYGSRPGVGKVRSSSLLVRPDQLRAVAPAQDDSYSQSASVVYRGRWSDPDEEQKPKPTMRSLIRGAILTIDQLWWDHRLNVTTLMGAEFRGLLRAIDRGDFRWEFLTPWRQEPLSTIDKLVVCVSFIGIAIVSQALWDPEASIWDHWSYIVFFFSYAIGNNLSLRILAILGSVLEIAAALLDANGPERVDVIPVTYESIFIVINAYYALRAFLAQQPVEFAPLEQMVYSSCFQPCGLRPHQFLKILEFAEWHVAVEDDEICTKGKAVRDLYVPLAGNFSIVSDGTKVGMVKPFELIGEVSLLEHLQSPGGDYHPPAMASMVAEAGSSYVRWPQSSFYELMTQDEDFAASMQVMISKALSKKLKQLWQGRGTGAGAAAGPVSAAAEPGSSMADGVARSEPNASSATSRT